MANLSLLGLWLHWTASVEHRQYCRLIIWKYLVAALVPVSEEVCRSVDVYQRGKLLTLELKTGTLLKLGVRFKVTLALPHQAGIELSDFHARVWKSDQGGRNSMQEMHGNQTKCMEFRPIKENSNFWTSIFCPGINFSCSKSLWIWWTIDPLILACLKLMTYASFSTKQLLAVLMDGNPCTNGWNSMHQNRKNVIASCFFEQSCLRQVKIQDPWQI